MPRQLFLMIILLATACQKSSGPRGRPVETSGPVVATFGDHKMTTAELQRDFSEQSAFVRSHYQTLERKREFLEASIQNDLLDDEGLKAGFDKDDEVQDDCKKAVIEQWIRAKFNDDEGMRNVSEAELHDYYNAHHDLYQRPERLRLQIVLFAGDAKARADAEHALKVLATKKDASGFAELARLRSDDPSSKMRGGDLDFQSHDELAKAYGEEVAKAADGLKAPDDISGVIHGPRGFYLVRLEARQLPTNRSFEEVERSMRGRLWKQKRAKLYDDYIANLMEAAHIKIDEAQLATIDPNQAGALMDEPEVPSDPGEARRVLPPTPEKDLHTPLMPLHPAAPVQPSNPAHP
jgi:parvulin-like peptidyl-prolyl isomerase